MAPQAVVVEQWTARQGRAADLAERWPFAAEMLTFYGALLEVQERVYAASTDPSDPSWALAYIAERVLPEIVDVTISSGPDTLARAVAAQSPARWEEAVRRWLAGEELPAVDRYMARAAAGPVLEALGPAAGEMCEGPSDPRHCPRCGGLPQVSILASAQEDLVASRRSLECSRCAWRWPYPRMTCAGCGETEPRHQPILAEEGTTGAEATGAVVRGADGVVPTPPTGLTPRFPHISVHTCKTCSRYLLNVDLSRDPGAVPVVDEIAAIPLDLYAREQRLSKIVPNLMGV